MCLRHIRIAENHFHALRFISQGAQGTPVDVTGWKIALVYYIACLHVRALACQRKKTFTRHFEVMQWLTGQADTLRFRDSYRDLEEHSRDARYDGKSFTAAQLQDIIQTYNTIMDLLLPLLAKDGLPGLHRPDVGPWLS